MLGNEDFMVIQALVKRGVYLCDIARQVGVRPKTVSRALARGSAPTPTRQRRTSLRDPYRAEIDRLLAEGVWNAVAGSDPVSRTCLALGGVLSLKRAASRFARPWCRRGRSTARRRHSRGWQRMETQVRLRLQILNAANPVPSSRTVAGSGTAVGAASGV